MYSEEDINMLIALRKWVIIPNVVGMTEAEALKTLHSLELVGRVIYEDLGKEIGKCFDQDIYPGVK